VYVVGISGGRVRIGVRPIADEDEVHVLRGELEGQQTPPPRRFDEGVFDE
jgi:sRNA-binding carbon storage regulator CsrA